MITLPEAIVAPENQRLESTFLLGRPIIRGYVSFRKCIYVYAYTYIYIVYT